MESEEVFKTKLKSNSKKEEREDHVSSCVCSFFEFEKWRAFRPSVGGVSGLLVWVVCQCGWGGWHACVGGVASELA